MCDLYLGAVNSRASTPPTPFWTNPSITCSTAPTYTFDPGTAYPIDVLLQNHDLTAGALMGGATVNLWWSDPTTSFTLLNQIGTGISTSILSATAVSDATATCTFNFQPVGAMSSINGGHICLAAVVGVADGPSCMEPAPSGPGDMALVTSPQVAIHNIHINAPPPPSPPPGPGPKHRGSPWPFFFGAANGTTAGARTRLVARAYDPQVEADRDRLWELAAHPGVRHHAGSCAKFAAPAAVHLATGVESVLLQGARGPNNVAQRLSYTGPVHPALADHLVKRDWTKSTANHTVVKELDLFPRQSQQAAVWVEPHGHEGHIYAVEVMHEVLRDGAAPVVIGGLTVVFVSLCRPW